MKGKKKRIAQYKQIEKDILDKIQTGYFKQNDMIPTELELSKTYNVSRVTVRRATDNLVAQGLLYRTAGVGTFVNHNPATQKIATLKSFTEEMEELGYGNDDIFVFEKTYMSVKDNPDISIRVLEESKYYYFEHVRNKKIDYSYHQTYPIMPPKSIAELFNLDDNTPIIKIGNTTYLEDGSILDYTELYLNSPKYQLNYIRTR